MTAFAGIHESCLNVFEQDQILTAIKHCFASLWTQRAVAYRRKMNIPDKTVEAAVVLMEMVHAQAAGVAFTCDPGTGREDVITVAANFGLGESVVSGVVEPDNYCLDAHSLEITKKAIGRKEKLTLIEEGGGTQLVTASDDARDKQVLQDHDISAATPMKMFPFSARSIKAFDKMLQESPRIYAHALGVPVVFANKCGALDTLLPKPFPRQRTRFPGMSAIADSDAVMKVRLGGKEGVIVTDVSLDPTRKAQTPPQCNGRWSLPVPWYACIWPPTEKLGRSAYASNLRRRERARVISMMFTKT